MNALTSTAEIVMFPKAGCGFDSELTLTKRGKTLMDSSGKGKEGRLVASNFN